MLKDKSNVLERYIKLALNDFKNVIEKKRTFNFRCNICGDGTSKHSRRGWIKYHEKDGSGHFYFKCFNDGCTASGDGNAWSADKWLKRTNHPLYNSYIKDLFSKDEPPKEIKKEVKPLKYYGSRKVPDNCEYFRITSEEKQSDVLFEKAIDYCQERFIPENIWKSFFICTKGKYKDRMIIPFFDNKKQIYYFQARTLIDAIPKYLNKTGAKGIYNIDFINKDEYVNVFEGPIDSMFVENSIAILGLSYSEEVSDTLNSLKIRWILDNDKSGIANSKKMLKGGYKVFIWKEFLKDLGLPSSFKDMNDIIIALNKKEGFTNKELDKYFTNSIYDEVKL